MPEKIDLENLKYEEVLEWLKKFGVEVADRDIKSLEGIEANEDSVAFYDDARTKLLITRADYKNDEIVRFDLKQIEEVARIVKEGTLILRKDKEFPAVVKTQNTIILIAPLAREEE